MEAEKKRFSSRLAVLWPSGRMSQHASDLTEEELKGLVRYTAEGKYGFIELMADETTTFVNISDSLFVQILGAGELVTESGIIVPEPGLTTKLERVPDMR